MALLQKFCRPFILVAVFFFTFAVAVWCNPVLRCGGSGLGGIRVRGRSGELQLAYQA